MKETYKLCKQLIALEDATHYLYWGISETEVCKI